MASSWRVRLDVVARGGALTALSKVPPRFAQHRFLSGTSVSAFPDAAVLHDDDLIHRNEAAVGEAIAGLRQRVHGEFINYAAIGIWNKPWQWLRQA
jgi:hypothetical protein